MYTTVSNEVNTKQKSLLLTIKKEFTEFSNKSTISKIRPILNEGMGLRKHLE